MGATTLDGTRGERDAVAAATAMGSGNVLQKEWRAVMQDGRGTKKAKRREGRKFSLFARSFYEGGREGVC